MGGILITNANMATSASKTFLGLLIQGAEIMCVQFWAPACPCCCQGHLTAASGKRNLRGMGLTQGTGIVLVWVM